MPSVECPTNLRFRCIPINSGETGLTAEQLAAVLAPIFGLTSVAVIIDRKAQGTDGGTFTNGAWRTRDLNTILTDESNLIVSLSSNQVTLIPGRYLFTANVPARAVTNHMSRLQNITDGVTVEFGQSVQTGSAVSDSIIVGEGIFTVNTTLEVQHQGRSNQNNNGFGSASNFAGAPETYTQLVIRRQGDA